MGTYADFVIDDAYFHTGAMAAIVQNLDVWNGVSRGAIRMVDKRLPGHFAHNLSYKDLSNAWTRRDITSAAAISGGDTKKMQEVDEVSVKLNRKFFLQDTRDKFKKSFATGFNGDAARFSEFLGGQVATAKMQRAVNDALLAGGAALLGQIGTNGFTIAANGTMVSGAINTTRAKLGDQASRIVCMISHSKPYYDLVGDQTAAKVTGITDYNLFEGVPATYGIPTLVTDSPSLTNPAAENGTDYYTLLLVEGAIEIEVSEDESMVVENVTGAENLLVNMQGEAAYNVRAKGFKWDVTNGGINPTDAALGTSTNWDLSGFSSHKHLAGAILVSK